MSQSGREVPCEDAGFGMDCDFERRIAAGDVATKSAQHSLDGAGAAARASAKLTCKARGHQGQRGSHSGLHAPSVCGSSRTSDGPLRGHVAKRRLARPLQRVLPDGLAKASLAPAGFSPAAANMVGR